MKSRICLLLSIFILLLSACGQAENGPSSPQGSEFSQESQSSQPLTPETETVTFVDDLGRTVTVEQAQRVAPLIGSFADIWALAGGADTIVAAANDTWTSFDLGLSNDVVNLGATTEISLEALIAAEPDLVIGSTNTDIDVALEASLTEMGITVAYFHVDSFEEYLHMLDICTQITHRPDLYEQYGEAVRAQVEAAKALADGSEPSVLYIRATGSSCKAKNSEGTVLGEMLADLGCRNVADSETSLLENLSMEAILAADPDDIFLIYQGSDTTNAEALLDKTLLSNPAWSTLRAVEEGRCYVLDSKLYNLKPNGRWGTAYEELAKILYPAE